MQTRRRSKKSSFALKALARAWENAKSAYAFMKPVSRRNNVRIPLPISNNNTLRLSSFYGPPPNMRTIDPRTINPRTINTGVTNLAARARQRVAEEIAAQAAAASGARPRSNSANSANSTRVVGRGRSAAAAASRRKRIPIPNSNSNNGIR
jgi:hypothetical protein